MTFLTQKDGVADGNQPPDAVLSSQAGGNNFKSFLAATPTSYSIGLFSVSSAYTMDAKMNLFSVSPPLTIADGSHDTAAGGRGSILT